MRWLMMMALAMFVALPAVALTPAERAMVAAVNRETKRSETLLEQLVNINSGTMNFEGVARVGEMMKAELEPLGFQVRWVPQTEVGRAGHLIAEHPASEGSKAQRILLIGHLDTVFEPSSPFQAFKRLPNGWAEGPGVNDMKGGLVIMVQALRAMDAAKALKDAHITVVLTGDEERVGTPTTLARVDLISAANKSDVGLDFEGLVRIDGKDMGSISRRSASGWTVKVTAKSGHSSGVFGAKQGDGAAYELTRILSAFRKELPEPYLTYNVGLMLAGSSAELNADQTGGTALGKNNVIPGVAIAKGDMRTLTNEQTARVRGKMREIVARGGPGATAEIQFEDGYPAMAPTEASRAVLAELNKVNKELGLARMEELDPLQRGAGDIAFVADLVHGLNGMGAAGEGSHAPGEKADLKSLPVQARRAAILIYRLSRQDRED